MTKAVTVAFLLQFDSGPHHRVAKKKFHHIVNTTNIFDFAGPSHMQKANKKDRQRRTCLDIFWMPCYVKTVSSMSRQCHFRFRPEGDSGWKPRVIQGDSG